MLPDFPALKTKLNERVIAPRMLAVELSRMGPFAESPKMVIHEGGQNTVNVVVHEDGTVDHSTLAHVEVKVEEDLRELEHLSPDVAAARLDEVARQMGDKMLKKNMEKLHAVLEAADRGIDLKGEALSADAVLEVWRSMLIPFNDKGEPIMPTMIAHPDVARRLYAVLEAAKEDEQFSRRYLQMIQDKRDEWHVREASRKLVG